MEQRTSRVIVVTSDRYLWTLRPFALAFETYWPGNFRVDVLGYQSPRFGLPLRFNFVSMGRDPGPDKWTDPLLKYLSALQDSNFILMLDDYWLCRPVDVRGVEELCEFMQFNADVMRMDLTSDRQFAGGAKDVGYVSHFDLVETDENSPYQFSLQAAIWDRQQFLRFVPTGWSPWQAEMHIGIPNGIRVMGTKQCPVHYANAVQKGVVDIEQLKMIEPSMRSTMENMIPKRWQVEIPTYA